MLRICEAVATACPDPAREPDLQAEPTRQCAGPAPSKPTAAAQWGTGEARSFLVPAYEIVAFELLVNRFNRYAVDAETYPSPLSNLHNNLHRSWVVDNDKFSTNQFFHPYQGSIYQGLARSSGLGFWEASAYTFAGSLLWEEAGEGTAASINDQISTGIGGSFIGEPLFRIASLLLESGFTERGGWWREFAIAGISPALALNRLAYGKRFAPVFPSFNPAVFTRVDVGANLSTHYTSNVRVNSAPSAPAAGQAPYRGSAGASVVVGYGLPGKPDYEYSRPFDYFNLEVLVDNRSGFESAFARGLLYGASYESGDHYRGLWGVYGLYDYVAPEIFRVSNTAAALGTTAQWWLSQDVALQGTVLAAVGYAGGGQIRGSGVGPSGPIGDGDRDYHYGVTPESVLALRLIVGDRFALDGNVRGYYISKLGSTEKRGSETIQRYDAALTIRVYGHHGITIRYIGSKRLGLYANAPDSRQTIKTIGIGYTLLGSTQFGAVDWRQSAYDVSP